MHTFFQIKSALKKSPLSITFQNHIIIMYNSYLVCMHFLKIIIKNLTKKKKQLLYFDIKWSFTWVLLQDVDVKGFKVCLKDIQPFDARHDPVTVHYLAVGCEYNYDTQTAYIT